MRLTSSRCLSGGWLLALRIPRPPAFVTAATSSGLVAVPIPPSTTGCLIPSRSQMRVCSTFAILRRHAFAAPDFDLAVLYTGVEHDRHDAGRPVDDLAISQVELR